MKRLFLTLWVVLLSCLAAAGKSAGDAELLSRMSHSLITSAPADPSAVYFTPGRFDIAADGSRDVSDALQEALSLARRNSQGCGILFVPEGTYRISRTICIPACVRLIGYGRKRPEFVLARQSPGFSEVTPETQRGKYVFWFIGGDYREDGRVGDAGSGTFYSSIINADIRIEDGNPNAVGIRAHFAQHCSISSVTIRVGKGRAGIVDAGNHLIDVAVYGGDYGIDTRKAAPGWPIMLVNTWFEGQRKAALRTSEGSLTVVRSHVRNVPVAVEIAEGSTDRLFMEDCIFENVSRTGVILSDAGNSATQVNLRNIQCEKVPSFAREPSSGEEVAGQGNRYRVGTLVWGISQDDLAAVPSVVRRADLAPLAQISPLSASDTPLLPDTGTWVNIRDLGAKGDAFSDDTQVFQEAVEKYDHIYIPQGWYVVKEPLHLKENTCLIGLHPGTTLLLTLGGNPSFSGFGAPQAQITAPSGGRNIVTGLFFNADAYNYRAVNVKWMAGEGSYLYDVKFSGHDKDRFVFNGQRASNPLETPAQIGPETENLIFRAWDNQHWSLWVTDGGGGTFRDIWTANEYSSAGLYVSHTATPGRIYGMSLEHHLRAEAIFRSVSGWKVYAMQCEEEADGTDVQQVELSDCRDLVFANLYTYRVSRMTKGYPSAVRTWNCRDIEWMGLHNYAHARIKFTSDASVLDMASGREARRWELARLYLSGKETPVPVASGALERVGGGFEFADGLTADSRGNIYFCENRLRRIYRYSADGVLSSVADFPWNPVALACDESDRLLVVTKYIAQPGYNNDDTRNPRRPLFGWRGSGGLWGFTYVPKVFVFDPSGSEATFEALPLVAVDSVAAPARVLYPANRSMGYAELYGGRPSGTAFSADEGRTLIPVSEDLFRCSSLVAAVPQTVLYSVDEYHQQVIRSDVDPQGHLHGGSVFASGGDRGVLADPSGHVYVTDGNVSVYRPDGSLLRTIPLPERPTSLAIAGGWLYITTVHSLFRTAY